MAKVKGSYNLDKHVKEKIEEYAKVQKRPFTNMLSLVVDLGLKKYEEESLKWIKSI